VSDTFGRFRVILTSLIMLLVGLALSMVAQNVATLIIARALIGFGNGILTTTAALAMGEAHPEKDRRRAAVITSAAITVSFGVGPVVGGVLAQINIYPLIVPYVFIFVLAVFALFLVVRSRDRLQGPEGVRVPLSISPRIAIASKGKRGAFLCGCAGGFFAFTVGCMFASLVPSLIVNMHLIITGPIVVALAFLVMSIASTLVQVLRLGLAPFMGLALGMGAFGLSVLALMLSMSIHNIWLLGLSMVMFGIGQGLGFMHAAMIASLYADEEKRTANMSTFFLSAYIGATVPVIGVGILADHIGLESAIYTFGTIAVTGLIALTMHLVQRHLRSRVR
jgi:MFS family permease